MPGTVSDESSASVNTLMQHNAPNAVGSIHSHPSGVLRPSATDRGTFRRGDVHIILGRPYGWTDWQAFDGEGNPIDLAVLDVDLPEDEFFEVTQEAIDHEPDTELGSSTKSGDDKDGGLLSWCR